MDEPLLSWTTGEGFISSNEHEFMILGKQLSYTDFWSVPTNFVTVKVTGEKRVLMQYANKAYKDYLEYIRSQPKVEL